MNVPKIDLPRIVVIGCGFAGLKLCKKINTKNHQVVLLDKNNYHTFQPLMYQVASAGVEPDSIIYPIRKVFKGKKNFHFRMTEVKNVDTDSKTVHTSIGDIDYDHLVIATGAATNYFGNENIEQNSMPMKSLVEALNLRSLILQNFEKALNTKDLAERESLMNFVIVGAGATGVELAGALAELKKYVLPNDYPELDIRRMEIHLIEASGKVLGNMSEKASSKSEVFLRKMGVNIWLDTMVKDYDGHLITTNKNDFQSKTLIWAAGVKGAPTKGLNVELNHSNRIVVDEFNKIAGLENVYAIGDVSSVETANTPRGHAMLASVAEQQGKQLGKNFNRISAGKEMQPFKYSDKGTMATIGRNLAVVDLSFIQFGGLFAWITWMFVHLMLLVDFRNRLIVFMNWAWSYVNYDKGTRLIVREYKKEAVSLSVNKKEEIIKDESLSVKLS